jgi:putative aldouronate transport system substrate-binding protein
MKSRKLLNAVLASLFVLAMAGCATASPAAGTTPSQAAQAAESAQEASAAPALEPVTITIRNVQPGKDWASKDTPVGQVFFERTGVNIEMTFSVGDENQTIALIIASGDMPDLVSCHYLAAPFVDANAAMELTALIDNSPNYKKALGSFYDRMVWSKEDRGRYFICMPEQYPEPLDNRNWFLLQHAVVIDQGYPQITTLQQYEDAIKAYKDKYPEIDGAPTIGMSLICDTWRWILSLTNPAMMAAGTESSCEVYVDQATGKVTYRVTRPEEKEYFRWLNHMYNAGLLDKEAFTQTYDQYKAKVATGRVLALTDMVWEIGEAETTLKAENKPERCYGSYPVVVKEGIVNSTLCGERKYITPSAELVMTTSCKAPERFMQFLDYVVTDEGQILDHWGIEGVHYDVVDGKRVFRPEEMQKMNTDPDYGLHTGVGMFWFLGYIDGVKDPTGQYYTLSSKENIVAQYTDVDKQVLGAYGKETWADFYQPTNSFKLRAWPEDIYNKMPADAEENVIFQKLQDIVKKDVVRAIVAAPDQFDTEWDVFLQEMQDAGQAKFEAKCEQMMRDQLEIAK